MGSEHSCTPPVPGSPVRDERGLLLWGKNQGKVPFYLLRADMTGFMTCRGKSG